MFIPTLFIIIGALFLLFGLVGLAIEEPLLGILSIFMGTILGSVGLVTGLVS